MENLDLKSVEPIFKRYGVKYAGAFGSRVRGQSRVNSDLDVLVRLGKTMGLVQFLKLEQELSNQFNLKVDLVTENSLSPYFREEVIRELQPIYEAK